MDAFFDELIHRAATIDELLGDDFEVMPGQKGDAERAAARLVAWCRSCSSGDWLLFERRLERDGLSIGHVLAKFATVRRRDSAARPAWIEDAIWIDAALHASTEQSETSPSGDERSPCPFEHLLIPVVDGAEARLRGRLDPLVWCHVAAPARADLRHALLTQLSRLVAPALYESFDACRTSDSEGAPLARSDSDGASVHYTRFIAEMRAGGVRRLCQRKPVLLRLLACLTRQWIDTTHELLLRLDADLPAIRRELLSAAPPSKVAAIDVGLSDPHNGGHTVQIVRFESGQRVVYKPRDMQFDAAWHHMIEQLNRADSPVQLKPIRTLARDGYGWAEFIAHTDCTPGELPEFFRRAGAWLALFHCFGASDMHHENLIATGSHPVPIDLEMILQATTRQQQKRYFWRGAVEAAVDTLSNSVLRIGLIPGWGRSRANEIYLIGGLASVRKGRAGPEWSDMNSDRMKPCTPQVTSAPGPNLPHVDGRYATLGEHLDTFISGFEQYARFLMRRHAESRTPDLFEGFEGLSVRMATRQTRFYYLLLQRLRDHRTMEDGVSWSAQADVIARLADWEWDSDIIWPLQRAERAALIDLNVPHFMAPVRAGQIRDATNVLVHTTGARAGLDRARERLQQLNEDAIAAQRRLIVESTSWLTTAAAPTSARHRRLASPPPDEHRIDRCLAEARNLVAKLSSRAIRQNGSAAWIALNGVADSDFPQFTPLGLDLYHGVAGIGVFLAAHAAVTHRESSRLLALAAIDPVRQDVGGLNAARTARSLGIGGATGWGSVVYALTVMSRCLGDDELLADAHAAAALFTDDLIATDRQLDVVDGSAGAILCLLRLYRESASREVLQRAVRCGEHVLRQRRFGPEGQRSWRGRGVGRHVLTGMSHGAAGFAYALTALSAATGDSAFARSAAECLAFENSHFDAEHNNWPDVRSKAPTRWPCHWCHGAVGIGLARIAMARVAGLDSDLVSDIQHACEAVRSDWPNGPDTLCCGTLGGVELLRETAQILGCDDLRDLASLRLLSLLTTAASTDADGWQTGKILGLFRGIAGVGYTLLREVDRTLPNVLVWE